MILETGFPSKLFGNPRVSLGKGGFQIDLSINFRLTKRHIDAGKIGASVYNLVPTFHARDLKTGGYYYYSTAGRRSKRVKE